MASRKSKKNYVEDMDRDFNNAKFAYDLCVKKGRPTESLNDIVGQITLEAIGYVVRELTEKLEAYDKEVSSVSEEDEWSDYAYLRLNLPWPALVNPAYDSEFRKASKSIVALEALSLVSTFSTGEIEEIEKYGKDDFMDQTIDSFTPIREFYERNTM